MPDSNSPRHLANIERSVIILGDALDALALLPDETVQCAITSPPYWGLRDYDYEKQIGLHESMPDYISKLTNVFSEVKRILKPNGVFWLNIGDGYTSGNRKWRAPDKKNRARAMNIRPDTPAGLKSKDLLGLPWRLAFSLQDAGWYLRSDIIWNKPNAMPESVKDRPTRSHEYIFMLTKSEKYFYNHDQMKENNGRNRRTVWNINTRPFPGAHFATFPEDLILPCILASTNQGDFVLDPFFGAGTTGLVAKRCNRKYIGVELYRDYVLMAAGRIEDDDREIIQIFDYDDTI